MKESLKKSPVNLPGIIKQLEELILASSGLDPFEEILKLIYVKLYTERTNPLLSDPQELFNSAQKIWPGIFSVNEKILLSDEITTLCLKKIENIQLMNTDLQIIDTAFEYLLPKKAKGDRGQYLTPRHIITEIIKIINPQKGEIILDPACGSGGFLLHTAKFIKTDGNIYGIDFDHQMYEISRILLLLSGLTKVNIINADSLSEKNNLKNNSFDVIMTNPPFGGEIKDKDVLNKSELAKDKKGKTKNYLERHILFIEKIIKLLKPGGRAAIIVPQGILNNNHLRYVREWIYSQSRIIGVVGLDTHSFKPFTNVKTSLLFLQKWTGQPPRDYPVFMAVSQKSGKNLSGNLIYKNKKNKKIIDSDLPEITKNFRKFIQLQKLNF